MTSKKPYEMTFSEFAETINPAWSFGVKFPQRNASSDPGWITSVWDSTEKKVAYGVSWFNEALGSQLPSEAQSYSFDDDTVHPFTKKLGLNPEITEDNVKAAQLWAMRDAWIAAIKQCCSANTPINFLSHEATTDYLLLTSGVIIPWMNMEVMRYIAEQRQRKLDDASKPNVPINMPTEPKKPNAQSMRELTSKLAAKQRDKLENNENNINYWLDLFGGQDRNSEYDMDWDAWNAQEDIDIAIQKVAALQKIIDKQNALIRKAGYVVRKYKLLKTASRAPKKIGRPEKSIERQKVAIKFTTQWVLSLRKALNAKSCAELEAMLNGSSQRNWRRWLNGKAVPTHRTLSNLLNEEIISGPYINKPLIEVKTNPPSSDLLTLISRLKTTPEN